MTSKEALRKLMLDDFTPINDLVYRKGLNNEVQIAEPMYLGASPKDCYNIIDKDLDLLDLYKKFFKYSLTEIQGIKYLVLPNNSDIRRPDSMLKITDEEYELLKVGLENERTIF